MIRTNGLARSHCPVRARLGLRVPGVGPPRKFALSLSLSAAAKFMGVYVVLPSAPLLEAYSTLSDLFSPLSFPGISPLRRSPFRLGDSLRIDLAWPHVINSVWVPRSPIYRTTDLTFCIWTYLCICVLVILNTLKYVLYTSIHIQTDTQPNTAQERKDDILHCCSTYKLRRALLGNKKKRLKLSAGFLPPIAPFFISAPPSGISKADRYTSPVFHRIYPHAIHPSLSLVKYGSVQYARIYQQDAKSENRNIAHPFEHMECTMCAQHRCMSFFQKYHRVVHHIFSYQCQQLILYVSIEKKILVYLYSIMNNKGEKMLPCQNLSLSLSSYKHVRLDFEHLNWTWFSQVRCIRS